MTAMQMFHVALFFLFILSSSPFVLFFSFCLHWLHSDRRRAAMALFICNQSVVCVWITLFQVCLISLCVKLKYFKNRRPALGYSVPSHITATCVPFLSRHVWAGTYVSLVTNCWSRVLENHKCTHLVKNSSPVMEPEGSLLCAQEPFSGSFPGPDESNLHPQTVFLF